MAMAMADAAFQVRCETPFGSEVRVVGSVERLGNWDPGRGLRLSTSPRTYPVWRSRPTILPEVGASYKFVIVPVGGAGSIQWEAGPNRSLTLTDRDKNLPSCEGFLVRATFGDTSNVKVVRQRAFPDRRAFQHLRSLRRRQGGLCAAGPSRAAPCMREEPARTFARCLDEVTEHSTGSAGSIADVATVEAADNCSGLTRASSTDSMTTMSMFDDEEETKNHHFLVLQQSLAETVDVWGSFTQPPWGRPLPLHLCPETGVWWLAIEEEFPQLQRGNYEFKFCVDGRTWRVNDALPVCEKGGHQNNVLRIDHLLRMSIQQNASQRTAQAVEKALATALVGDSDVDSNSTRDTDAPPAQEGGAERQQQHQQQHQQQQHQLRRVASTAERMPYTASTLEVRDISKTTRSYSVSRFGDQEEDVICDLVGESGEGGLYGNDVAFLLELPDAKRKHGLGLSAASYARPKDGAGAGEDSFFVELPALGVADGVGGLQPALGYTSKAFADELMAGCKASTPRLVKGDNVADRSASDVAKNILVEGWNEVRSYGASTAVVAYMDTSKNKLGIAIVGDSGVMVVRRPTCTGMEAGADHHLRTTRCFVAFKTPPQQHDFNYPFQLCRLPRKLSKLLARQPDTTDDAVTYDISVEEGDLVLVYSDGLDDNLFEKDVLDLCDRALSPYAAHVLGLPREHATPPEVLSRTLGSAAYLRSLDPAAKTPFTVEARKAGWPTSWCNGGKEDDITCLAAWVTHNE